jgi:hypothetical protein
MFLYCLTVFTDLCFESRNHHWRAFLCMT